MPVKTPKEVSDAIKKLSASDQVLVQRFIAKLKSTIEDLEVQVPKDDDNEEDDGHAHFHGHEKCTADHSHGHEHAAEEDHEHSSHDHHEHHHHQHGHDDHINDHDNNNDIPAWKQKAMNDGSNDPTAAPFGGSWTTESSVNAETDTTTEPPFPPLYDPSTSPQNTDAAMTHKQHATHFKSDGNYPQALDEYTLAITSSSPSSLLYANRADCLLRLHRPLAAMRDCDEALRANPDSAKALRIRGKAKKLLEDYDGARADLSAAQSIDFDGETAMDLKFVMEKVGEREALKVKKRLEEEERLKQRAREVKKAQEEAKKNEADKAASAAGMGGMGGIPGMPGMGGGIPGMGGAGGMPGMGGLMSSLMSDPELAAGMSNPKIMGAFSKLMSGPGGPASLLSNPAKLQELMADPEVGPFLQKLLSKMGMGGMSGMGGMPGMGGMGGMGGGDDIPDMDDIPDLDMD